jgi:hypothetical protein
VRERVIDKKEKDWKEKGEVNQKRKHGKSYKKSKARKK